MNLSFLFFFIGLFNAILVIATHNPIHNVFALILLFLDSSLFLMFLEAYFIAFILIIIYLGAVIILILFTLMMLNIKTYQLFLTHFSNLPIGSTIAAIYFSFLI
jgi:NADH-quinone oxidoreductase subunit J